MTYTQIKNLVLRSISVAAVTVVSHGSVFSVNAQTVTLLEDEMTVDPWAECSFVGANVNEGIAADPENFERELFEEMLSITPVIERFVDRSMEHTDLSMRSALGLFSRWYIARLEQQNAEERTEREIIRFIGQALEKTLNVAFPGSGSFAASTREIGNGIYQTVENSSSSTGERDPTVFLSQLSERLENNNENRRSFSIAFFENIHDQELRELLDEIKRQEVMERRRGRAENSIIAGEDQLHHCAELNFSEIGIYRPEVNSDLFKIHFLIDLIQEVMCDEWANNTTVGTCETPYHLRLIRTEANNIATRLVGGNGR